MTRTHFVAEDGLEFIAILLSQLSGTGVIGMYHPAWPVSFGGGDFSVSLCLILQVLLS